MKEPIAESIPLCNVCLDSRCEELAHLTSDLDKEVYHVMKCKRCGLLFLYPLPNLTPEKLEAIYGENYAETVFPLNEIEIIKQALHKQMAIVERYGQKGSVLNVGAMSGDVLEVFKERHWQLRIVEVSKYAVERTRSSGDYDITLSKIEDFSCPPESFDFIKLGHVIEHLANPAMVLEKLWALLRPGGLILIDTDNANGLETMAEATLMPLMQMQPIRHLAERMVGREYHLRYGRLTPPVHLYTFTMKSLTTLVEAKGFDIVRTFNSAWGDPTWFPLLKRSMLETIFTTIDQLGARFGRGNVIAVLARKA